MARATILPRDHPLTDQQEQAVRDIAAGRIQRYGVPGEWQVYRDGGHMVLEDSAAGWTARIPMRR